MSFYVQLPSNGDNKNTTPDYRKNFDYPLPLNTNLQYEVGLVESIYTKSWLIPIGTILYGYLFSMITLMKAYKCL